MTFPASPTPPEGTVVYRWPDGGRVALWLEVQPSNPTPAYVPGVGRAVSSSSEPWSPGQGIVKFRLSPGRGERGDRRVGGALHPSFVADPRGGPAVYLTNLAFLCIGTETPLPKAEFLGFLLDAGVVRMHPSHRGLVSTHHKAPASLLDCPRWVPDDLWATRHDLARQRYLGELGQVSASVLLGLKSSPPFLGYLPGFVVQRELVPTYSPGGTSPPPGRGAPGFRTKFHVHSEDAPATVGFDFNEVVDRHLTEQLLVPASARAAWEEAHVLRGEWVLPGPDEVELFRVLGEDLPFFWGYDRCRAWLSERVG